MCTTNYYYIQSFGLGPFRQRIREGSCCSVKARETYIIILYYNSLGENHRTIIKTLYCETNILTKRYFFVFEKRLRNDTLLSRSWLYDLYLTEQTWFRNNIKTKTSQKTYTVRARNSTASPDLFKKFTAEVYDFPRKFLPVVKYA